MTYRAPGLLRREVNPDVIMMLCTAGHVDHGKTSLVKLLTGCNTDRLKIEQERGMTIELGFAPCWLGGNLCVGIVDVPGHEKFIHNMVAGVSGIDLAILTIAADDGIMPQTVEHVQIMELMGIKRGIVALTKIDLVTPQIVDQRRQEVSAYLADTFLAGAPIYPVSAETFEGYDEFYLSLAGLIQTLSRQVRAGVFRMPIERVFIRQGHGVVVTGIPLSGSVRVGETLELAPGGQLGKVRSIQRFLRDAGEGGAGQCLAINIPDFSKKPPVRGQMIARPGYARAAQVLHARLKMVRELPRPLRNAEAIKLHAGTVEAGGKVYLLESATAGEGQIVPATIVLDEPVAIGRHDRFILRLPSPPATIAGGEVWGLEPGEQRPPRKQAAERLQHCLTFFAGVDPAGEEWPARSIEYALLSDDPQGTTLNELARATLLTPEQVRVALETLTAEGRVLGLGPGFYIHRENALARYEEIAAVARLAGRENNILSLSAGDLRQGHNWPDPFWKWIDAGLMKDGLGAWHEGRFVLRQPAELMSAAETGLIRSILDLYRQTGFNSPRAEELPEKFGATRVRTDRLLEHLCNEGQLLRISPNVILSRVHFLEAQATVVRVIQEKGVLNSADFKLYLKTSRKYALAILDFLDARRVTIRIGNDRKLTANFQKLLLE